jgi:hypothetical protein
VRLGDQLGAVGRGAREDRGDLAHRVVRGVEHGERPLATGRQPHRDGAPVTVHSGRPTLHTRHFGAVDEAGEPVEPGPGSGARHVIGTVLHEGVAGSGGGHADPCATQRIAWTIDRLVPR